MVANLPYDFNEEKVRPVQAFVASAYLTYIVERAL